MKTILFILMFFSLNGYGFDMTSISGWARPFGSINASLLGYGNLHIGTVIFPSSQGDGFALSGSGGIGSSNFQVGFGHYSTNESRDFPLGASVNLMMGRTYFVGSIIPKNRTYYGVQAEVSLILALKAGAYFYRQRDYYFPGFNFEIGIGI